MEHFKDSSYYRMNSSGSIKVHSLCRKSYNSLAVLFWKKLFVVPLHILKVPSFPKAHVTWWQITTALICWKITNLRAFLDDLSCIQICSLSFLNTLHVKSRSRKCFGLRQSYPSPSPLFCFIAYPAGQESLTPPSLQELTRKCLIILSPVSEIELFAYSEIIFRHTRT